MELEEAVQHLRAVREGVTERFDGDLHYGRLGQLDAALSTAQMAVEHLYDEDVRHRHDPAAHARAVGAPLPGQA